jgi:hypothetical protein
MAELEVGMTLARIHEQATGGAAAKKATKRGYAPPWLNCLSPAEAAMDDEVAAARARSMAEAADRTVLGMTASSEDYARRRSAKRKSA